MIVSPDARETSLTSLMYLAVMASLEEDRRKEFLIEALPANKNYQQLRFGMEPDTMTFLNYAYKHT